MVSQSDYGTDSSSSKKLYVGTLTVYRHFDLVGDMLKPTGVKPMNQNYAPDQVAYPYENEFSAVCQAHSRGAESHQAPSKDCHCGYYASYDPTTDFYAYYTAARVFAACEVYGRIIPGTKGVRAEKMRLKGMWVQPKVKQVHTEDMEECRKPHESKEWWDRYIMDKREGGWIIYDAITSALRMRAAPRGYRFSEITLEGTPMDQETLALVAEAAYADYEQSLHAVEVAPDAEVDLEHLHKYGVPIFSTKEELLAAFPPDDVSAFTHKEDA